MDLLHLDFTKIEVSGDHEKELKKKPKVVNVLVVTDHFTRHTMAFVTEDTTAQTVARVLYHHYFYIFGTPLRLMMDNDLAFTSEVVQELCNLFESRGYAPAPITLNPMEPSSGSTKRSLK